MAERLFTASQATQKLEPLAQLLLGAKMIDPTKLSEASQTAKRLEVPLYKAITMLKSASETNLSIAVEASEMVLKGKIDMPLATKALILAKQNGIHFEDALNVMGTVVHKTQQMPSLGNQMIELLLAAHLISPDQTSQIMQQAQDAEMSVSRTLLVNRILSRAILHEALMALGLFREEKITKDQAQEAMSAAMQRRCGVLQVLFESGVYNECSGETLKLSELVLMAGLVNETDYLECLEISLLQDKSFGQAMMDGNLVTTAVLEAACSLLDMVGGYLKPFQAAEALKQVRASGVPIYQAVAELQPPPQVPQRELSLSELVFESGFQTKEAVVAAIGDSQEAAIKVGKRLMAASLLSETGLYKALRCYSLFKEGLLSADQAVTLMKSCRDEAATIEEALAKAGWNLPARMHWSWV